MDATFAAGPQRKYHINPRHSSGRLTACETCREIWRLAETLPEPARVQMQELAAQAFDMAKRMNARMVELRDR